MKLLFFWSNNLVRLFVGAVFALSLTAAANAQAVRVGFGRDYSPLSFIDENGVPVGFLVDLVSKLGDDMGLEIEFVANDWDSIMADLDTGEIDMLFGLYYSDERARIYRFGPDVFRNNVSFFQKNEKEELGDLNEAAGRKVGLSSPGSYIIDQMKYQFPNVDWVVFPTFESMLETVRIDDSFLGFVNEEFLFRSSEELNQGYFIKTGEPLMNRGLRPVVMRRSEALLERFSVAYYHLDAEWVSEALQRWGIAPKNQLGEFVEDFVFSEEELEFLARHPVIRYAGDSNWEPVAFRGGDRVFRGLEADFLSIIEERIGVKFVYPYFNDSSEVQEALGEGLADFRGADGSGSGTTSRFFSLPLGLVVSQGTLQKGSLHDLSGRTISVEKGNSYAQQFVIQHPEVNFRFVESESNGLGMVARQEVDAHMGNLAVCVHLIDTDFSGSLFVWDVLDERQELSFKVKEDEQWQIFVEILNKAIEQISDEQIREISRRWIQVDIRNQRSLIEYWKPLAAIAAIMLIVLLWRVATIRLRRQLTQTGERLLLAQKMGAGGLYEWYPDSKRVRLSPEFFEMLGYGAHELNQSYATYVRLMHPDDFAKLQPFQLELTKAGRESSHTFRMQRSDGTWAWIMAKAVPTHFNKDGSTKRYVGVQTDITILHETSEKLREQEFIAQQANRAKSEFLANMSHEIRTPMNAVLGFSRLLKRETEMTSRQNEYVQMISQSGEHLLELLDGILDMAKIEAGHVQLELQDWNVETIFSDLADIYSMRCKEKGLGFEFFFDSDLPSVIEVDGLKLRQVVANVLSNAAKFTKVGKIALRVTSRDGDEICIDVSDTGCGISNEDCAQLFQPFTQAKAGRSMAGGTGLGLSISKEFAQLLGGDLSVTSELGVGTCFSFIFPISKAKGEIAANDSYGHVVEIDPNAARSKRILVAEDDIFSLHYMRRLLSDLKFDVHMAKDGEEAIVMWKLVEPDLILLDMRMPKKNGYEVLERIQSETFFKKPKILVVTASAFSDERDRVMELGADEFMGKPFREEALLLKIAELLDLPYETKELVEATAISPVVSELQGEIILEQAVYDELVEACRGGYLQRVEATIDSLSETQPSSAEYLRNLALAFDYDKILERIQSNSHR